MVACFIFLLMAVKVYEVPAATMTTNLLIVILGLAVIMAIAAIIGRLMLLLRKRKKISVGPTLFLWSLSGHDRC